MSTVARRTGHGGSCWRDTVRYKGTFGIETRDKTLASESHVRMIFTENMMAREICFPKSSHH